MALLGSQIVQMNETDVRENIVRPLLLDRLGYAFNGPARVRTEFPLRYSRLILGRKKQNDPDLRGRSDYVCEVVSYGRWVIEVKGGAEVLTVGDAEQAHTYAAHPEIAAFYYLVTNGRSFRLYAGQPQTPEMEWTFDEMDAKWAIIENILGPDAIRRRALTYSIDTRKPLASGYRSSAKIVGGFLTYDSHSSPNREMMIGLEKMQGMQGSFTGKDVHRTDGGLIRARIEIRGPYKEWDDFNRAAGIDGYDFESAVEFVSTDPTKPTIFQGITYASIKTEQHFRFPGQPAQSMPFGIKMIATTEAIGHLTESKFQGTFRIAYAYELDSEQSIDLALIPEPLRSHVDQLLKTLPVQSVEALIRQHMAPFLQAQFVESVGMFEMNIQ